VLRNYKGWRNVSHIKQKRKVRLRKKETAKKRRKEIKKIEV